MAPKLMFWVLPLLIFSLLTGCSLLPERQPLAITYFSLPVTADAPGKQPGHPFGVLLLASPEAARAVATQQMAYRNRPEEIGYYLHSRWVDEPARMIASNLQLQLESLGGFDAVIPQGTPVAANWRLELELLDFIQDFSRSSAQFEARVRVRLIDVLKGDIVASRVVRETQPIEQSNAESGVAAAVVADQRLVRDISAFIMSALAQVAP